MLAVLQVSDHDPGLGFSSSVSSEIKFLQTWVSPGAVGEGDSAFPSLCVWLCKMALGMAFPFKDLDFAFDFEMRHVAEMSASCLYSAGVGADSAQGTLNTA